MDNLLNVIEKFWMSGERRKREGHYPSDALDCRRKLYWKWSGEEETNPIDATGFWRMNIGNSIHDKIQNDLAAVAKDDELRDAIAWEGFRVSNEVRSGAVVIDPSINGEDTFGGRWLSKPIRYRRDMIFTDSDGKLCGGEIKTKYGAGVRAMKETGLDDRQLTQVVLYLVLDWVLAERGEFGENGGMRRYYVPMVSRDDGDRVQFVVEMVGDPPNAEFVVWRTYPSGETVRLKEYGMEVFYTAIDRMADVEVALSADEVPERDFRVAIKNGEIRKDYQHKNVKYKSDWQCLYCGFKDKCWAAEVVEYADGNNSEIFQGGEE